MPRTTERRINEWGSRTLVGLLLLGDLLDTDSTAERLGQKPKVVHPQDTAKEEAHAITGDGGKAKSSVDRDRRAEPDERHKDQPDPDGGPPTLNGVAELDPHTPGGIRRVHG